MAATKIYRPEVPLSRGVRDIAKEFFGYFTHDMQTQKIYPAEVYPGYLKQNAERAKYHGKRGWFATGEGAQSVDVRVEKANDNNPSEVVMVISHLDYLKFADMGVNMWTTRDEVNTSKKAHYNKRYANFKGANRHRPVFAFGSHRLARRLENFMQDFYGQSIEFGVMQALTDDNHPLQIM